MLWQNQKINSQIFWPKKETVYHVYPKGALLLDIIQLFVLSGGAGLKKDFFM